MGCTDLDLSNASTYIGFKILGENTGDYAGSSVNNTGDVNNDGYDDMIISAPYADNYRGIIYVIYGQATKIVTDIDLSADASTYNGLRILGGSTGDFAGYSVASGDINNDGYDDMIVSAPYTDNYNGISYVVYGQEAKFVTDIELSNASTYSGFKILGANTFAGMSVSTAGDINNDGYDDKIISAHYADNFKGLSYVIYGSHSNIKVINLENFSPSLGFAISGANAYDFTGRFVSDAGDFDNDRYDVFYLVYGFSTH